MDTAAFLHDWLPAHWTVALVAVLLIWAAWIDGRELRVPNWLTFPMVLCGLLYHTLGSVGVGGGAGFLFGFLGCAAGLATLLPLRNVGGMGAGDVKLMAGMGAWLGWEVTLYAFAFTVIVGAVMAVAMVVWRGDLKKHAYQMMLIWGEWVTIRKPEELAAIARERKPRMLLLPYGIPICVGSIASFFYLHHTGLL